MVQHVMIESGCGNLCLVEMQMEGCTEETCAEYSHILKDEKIHCRKLGSDYICDLDLVRNHHSSLTYIFVIFGYQLLAEIYKKSSAGRWYIKLYDGSNLQCAKALDSLWLLVYTINS